MADLFRKKSVQKVLADSAAGFSDGEAHKGGLKRTLTTLDLTAFGIAAVVGAGIFSTIGKASFDGGPGIILLFLFVAVACGFSALCYAEFASMVPVSGSAYTYSYVAFGEIIAWIIGWDLLMEYAIGNIAVAISWSDYFTSLINNIVINGHQWHIPDFITMDYWTAHAGFDEVTKQLANGAALGGMDPALLSQYNAWSLAPTIGGIHLIADIPAFVIVAIITMITYIGIQESKRTANAMVLLKLMVILLVIALGSVYVNPANWNPFLPNGVGGILKGTAAVFFAYIGFDAISTTAEECKNPQRDLPRGMIYSLIICTVIYVAIALVITGMVNYSKLNVGDPLAFVFNTLGLKWIGGVVAVSAVIATASVLLVFQIGQPRIWMAMSRDGLLPAIFSKVHPKFQTPSFSTILTGLVVGIPVLFMNLAWAIDLTSVGTLFAFVLVCAGIVKFHSDPNRPEAKFKTPYVNGKFIIPGMFILTIVLLCVFNMDGIKSYLTLDKSEGLWAGLRHKVPTLLFFIIFGVVAVLGFLRNFSLLPVLGMLACTYLLCESGTSNWERFMLWLLAGFVIYFAYGRHHSKLNTAKG
jgi:APA family basic amino acid/polyamine antiporter